MHKILKYALLGFLFIGIVSCLDNSTNSPGPGEPPSLPQIQQESTKPDVSFFEDHQPKMLAKGDTSNYYKARNIALLNGVSFVSISFYNDFLLEAESAEPTYNDEAGHWEWVYSYNYEGMDVEIRLTAESTGNMIEWAQYWTYDSGQGYGFDNYKVFEGTINEDGSEGNWVFNTLVPDADNEVPAIEFEWTIESEEQRNIRIKYYESIGVTIGTVEYDQHGSEHFVNINNPDADNILIFWNSETNKGYIQEGGVRECWDENLKNMPCS